MQLYCLVFSILFLEAHDEYVIIPLYMMPRLIRECLLSYSVLSNVTFSIGTYFLEIKTALPHALYWYQNREARKTARIWN